MTKLVPDEIDRLAQAYSRSRDSLSEVEKLRLVSGIARATKNAKNNTEQKQVPKGYLALVDIQNSLVRRLWAGFGCAELVRQILRDAGKSGKRSAGFAPRRDYVAQRLSEAFSTGKMTLYKAVNLTRCDKSITPIPSRAQVPMAVPKELIGHVFIKGRMPSNFAIRPNRKAIGDDRLRALLSCGPLLVRESEFRRWLKSEKRKRKWPSQRIQAELRKGVGRPRTHDARLKDVILIIAREGAWNGRRPLTELYRPLVERGESPPSVDTIGRLVDEKFSETGVAALGRRRRIRRSAMRSAKTA